MNKKNYLKTVIVLVSIINETGNKLIEVKDNNLNSTNQFYVHLKHNQWQLINNNLFSFYPILYGAYSTEVPVSANYDFSTFWLSYDAHKGSRVTFK